MSYADLKHLFEHEASTYKDLFEPYVTLLPDCENEDETTSLMRRALRETFQRRYPIADAEAVRAFAEDMQVQLPLAGSAG